MQSTRLVGGDRKLARYAFGILTVTLMLGMIAWVFVMPGPKPRLTADAGAVLPSVVSVPSVR